MTIQELFELRTEINRKCESLLVNKGRDYSGEEDTLNNLRMGGVFGIVTRMGDKLWRLHNLTLNLLKTGDDEKRVTNESILDTVYDVRNYCDLFIAVYMEATKDIQEESKSLDPEPVDVSRRDKQQEPEADVKVSNPREHVEKTERSVGIVTGTQTTEVLG